MGRAAGVYLQTPSRSQTNAGGSIWSWARHYLRGARPVRRLSYVRHIGRVVRGCLPQTGKSKRLAEPGGSLIRLLGSGPEPRLHWWR